MDRLIRRRTLAMLLRVSIQTMARWEAQGLLRSAHLEASNETHYWQGTVDHWLAACRHNLARPLSYDQLQQGDVTLISVSEAATQMEVSHDAVQTQVEQRRLSGVQIGGQWRVTQASLDLYLTITQYTTAVAGNIIGLDRQATHLLMDSELERHPFSSRHQAFVTEASIDAYLERHVAPWVIASIWREERMGDPRPLLRPSEIARQLNRSPRLIKPHLEAERVDYLWSPMFRLRHYSPAAFDTYMDLERVLTLEEIAQWFSVHPTVVNRWRGLSLIHCPLPQHIHNEWPRLYRESCWRGIVQELLSPGLDAHLWIVNRKKQRTRLLGPHLAAARLGIEPEEVVNLAMAGGLRGIRTPEGEWKFTPDAVRRFKSEGLL